VRRLLPVALVALVGFPSTWPAHAADPIDRKAIEALGAAWWKARPRTCFDAWDPAARADLLARAKALGPIPEGSLEAVRDVLWRAIKKTTLPSGGKMTTPYGEATWIQNGRGGGKGGFLLGLHGGGEGAGSASEAAGAWNIPGALSMYPQGIRLVHDTWNTVHGERFCLTLLEIAKAREEIDPDRVVAAGFSMGGTGSWFLAGRHADLLAAACPCAGVLMAAPKSQVPRKEDVEALQHGFVPNVRNLPMYWFTGLADKNCMPGTYLYAWDVLRDLQKKDPTGYRDLHFTTYEGLAHAFPPGEPGKCLDWAAKQRRDPRPKKIVWEYATDPFPLPADDLDRKVGRFVKRDFYWLHCDRPEDRSQAVASIEGNVVDLSVTAGDANAYTIWLEPRMVDVAKEVVVRVDGKEVYRGKPVPDVETVLETLDSRLDRRLVFDRRVRLAKD